MPLNDSSTLYSLLDQHNSALKVLLNQQNSNNNTIKSLSSNTANNSNVTSLSNEVDVKANQSNVNNSFSNINTSLTTLNQNKDDLQNQVTQNKQDINNANTNITSLNDNTETKDSANSVHSSLSNQINSLNYANSELNTAIGPNAGSQISSLASQVDNFDNTTQKSLNGRINYNTTDIQSLSNEESSNYQDVNTNIHYTRTASIPSAINNAVSQAKDYTDQHGNTNLSSSVASNSNAISSLSNNTVDTFTAGSIANNDMLWLKSQVPNSSSLSSVVSSAQMYTDKKVANIHPQSSSNSYVTPMPSFGNNPFYIRNLTTPGCYSLSPNEIFFNSEDAPDGINSPMFVVIEVFQIWTDSNKNNMLMQKLTCKNGIYMRTVSNDGSNPSSWSKL